MRRIPGYILKGFIYLYQHAEGILLVVFAVMLVTDVMLGILARFVHFKIVFATELGKYIFIWLCAIGISAAAKDNQHVRINFLVNKLPLHPKISWILSQILFLIFSIILCFLGSQLTWMQFVMQKSVMGFQFPMFCFTAAIPIGFLLTSIRLIENIIHTVKSPDENNPWDITPAADMPGNIDEKNHTETLISED